MNIHKPSSELGVPPILGDSHFQMISWLVVSTPLKNIRHLGVGMMTFPIYGKIKNLPNHQPGDIQP